MRLSHPGVPDLDELNSILEPRTGWRTVAVTGLVPDDIFFAMLSERVFPVGNFIRRREQLDYLEEPDCFHDLFGHIPMLAHHEFAAMIEHIGRLGRAAIAAGHGERVARIYWHSVEFGLAREDGELKILGAGLASSFGEAHFSLESEVSSGCPSRSRGRPAPPIATTCSSRSTWCRIRSRRRVAEVLGTRAEDLLAIGERARTV